VGRGRPAEAELDGRSQAGVLSAGVGNVGWPGAARETSSSRRCRTQSPEGSDPQVAGRSFLHVLIVCHPVRRSGTWRPELRDSSDGETVKGWHRTVISRCRRRAHLVDTGVHFQPATSKERVWTADEPSLAVSVGRGVRSPGRLSVCLTQGSLGIWAPRCSAGSGRWSGTTT
jgi:hypothetical protein